MIAALTLSGCGGSSKPPTVAVTASVTTVDGTDTVKLTATVANDKGTDGVAWSVSGGGTLSDTTTTSATYTAPAATSAAQTVTVTATSVADTSKTGTATITVPAKLTITTTAAQLAGAVGTVYSVQLNTSTGISPYQWSLDSTSAALPTGWNLSSSGLLTGPAPVAGQAGTIDLVFDVTDSGTPTPMTAFESLNLVIASAPQITFSGAMPTTVTYNTAYAGSAAATGGVGTLTYSKVSGSLPPGVTLTSTSTGQIGGTPTAAGTYNFSIQAADGYGDSATQAYTITVTPATPALAFASIPAQTYGSAPFQVIATDAAGTPSSGAITYALTAGQTSAGTVTSSGMVTITGAGTIYLTASQAASGNYAAATATTSVTVAAEVPTLTFASIPAQTYGGAPFQVSATDASSTPSNGAITYALTGGQTSAGTVTSGGLVTITGAGTIYLTASQAASGNFAAATATTSVSVAAEIPALSFTAIPAQTFGSAPFQVSASSASGGAVTYALTAGQTSAGTVTSAGVVTLTGAGTVYLTASQAANGNYTAATATTSFTVNPGTPTLTFTTIPAQTFGVAPFQVSASSASSGAVTYTLTAGQTSAGTVTSAGMVTITGVGTVYLTASQAATANYLAATATTSFTVGAEIPTLTFASIPAQTYGGPSFQVTATDASGTPSSGAITYALTAGQTSAGTVTSAGVVTITGAGTIYLTASQAASGNYAAATATTTVTVNGEAPGLAFTAIPAQTYGNAPFQVSAADAAGTVSIGTITYSLTAGHTSAGTVTGSGMVTITGAGTIYLTASQAANGNYASATATTTVAVATETPALSFAAIPVQMFGNAPFSVSASSASSGAVTYSLTAGQTSSGTVTGAGLVTITGAGTIYLTASQAASGNYAAATATTSFTVYPELSINSLAPPTGYPGTPYPATTFTATGGSGTYATWSWSAASGSTLPAGLSLSTGGTISGTPTNSTSSAVISMINVKVTDSVGNTTTEQFPLTIDATLAIITPATLPGGTAGVIYSATLAAIGGTGTYTWSVPSSTDVTCLAARGVSLSSAGVLSSSGVALTSGNVGTCTNFGVQVSDNATPAHTVSIAFTLSVSAITFTKTSLPFAITGQPYAQTLGATGGTGTYAWTVSVNSSGLAAIGLSLNNSSGSLSGNVPTSAATSPVTFTVTVTDSSNASATQQYTINVYAPLTLPTAGSLHAAITGADYGVYDVGINASGGSGSYSFSVNGTSIPNNSFPTPIASADSLTGANSGGNTLFLGGTPPDSETITLNVTVTDTGVTPNQSYGPIQYTIVAAPQQPLALPAPGTNPLPTPVNINQGYNGFINASGGANGVNYSFTVQIGTAVTTVPITNSPVTLTGGNGLTAQNSGGFTLSIGGTPTTAGNLTLLVTVNDTANDPPASQSYPISIVNPLAGYNVSGTVNYLGSKTGWIYLQLSNNSCPNCGGNPGTAIPAKGTFTIKGVQAGTYTLQAYMDPSSLGFGAPNASDPTGSTSNIAVSNGAVSGANVTLADPGAITFGSAPSISVAGAFATGALVQFSNLPTNSNSMELATSYTVQYSTSPTFSTGAGILSGSQSFPATGGKNAPSIVSGLTNGKTYYFEVQAVAGSSTSSWSSPTPGVAIVATPATGNNAVSGHITFPGTATGPLYVGFYDQNTSNVYATVVGTKAAPPTSPASYSVNVPTGSNYYFFGIVDQNNNGVLDAPGQISNTNQQSSAVTVINAPTTTENLTLPTSGTAPKNSEAVIRTQHNQQINSSGTNDNYNIEIRVDGLYKLPVSVELTSKPAAGAVVVPSDWATGAFNGNNNEFDFQPNLNGVTPQVGDAYNLLITYSDSTPSVPDTENLPVTIGAVLNAFATLVSPASQATNVSPTPNFSWTDPTPSGNYSYQFQLQDSNYNTIWQIPGNHSNSNGMSNSITSITWDVDPTGSGSLPSTSALNSLSMYQWSIQAADTNGNSATEQVSFETGESSLTLPSNSTPGSALINSPYSQSLNASGGSGSGYVFTVNSSAGTTNAGVTTWTLTDGLTASSTVGNSTLTVSGTPTTAPSTVTLAVAVVDSQSHSAGPVTYTINVVNGPNGTHNSYLNGTYVCKFDGFNDSDGSRWASLSSLVISGSSPGTITSGVWDMNSHSINSPSSPMSGTATGTYSISSDNNGLMTVNSTVTSGGSGTHSSQYAIALNNLAGPTASEFRMVESDDVGASPSGHHGAGLCYQATTSAFAASTLSGNSFVYGEQGEDESGLPEAWVGRFTAGTESATGGTGGAAGGSITNGINDGMYLKKTSDGGNTFTGSYAAPNSNGRFTMSIPITGLGTEVIAFYIIDANRAFMLVTAGDGGVQSGDVRKQQQSSYSGSNLNGAFVLYNQGFEYSNSSVSGYDSGVSQATGNGAGNITINQSYQDSDGTYQAGKENGATIGVTFDSSNPGRVTFSPPGGGDSIFWYFFDTNSAFHLDLNGSGYLETGWLEPQTQTTFTDAAVAGTYLFGQMTVMQEVQDDAVGVLDTLNNGTITGGLSEGDAGYFTWDQAPSWTYSWDTTAPDTGSLLVAGTGDTGGDSCVVISATRVVCTTNADSWPAVGILQQ